MGLICRKILRNTFCSIPFLLGLTVGVLIYLQHVSIRNENNSVRSHGPHSHLPQETSLLDKLETNINLLKDLPQNNYVRPRFIRDEINITDHLFFGIVHQNTAPKNFLRYHNLTTSQLNKKFVVFQQTETKDIDATAPFVVKLDDLSLTNIFQHIQENHPNYIYYFVIDSTALVNGAQLSDMIQKLYFKSDFIIGHPAAAPGSASKSGVCDLSRGFLVHQHLLEVLSNQSAVVDCVSDFGGISYVALASPFANAGIASATGKSLMSPTVVHGLTSELDYQSAAKRILQDQVAKLEARLDSFDEEIELFIDESDYLEVEWPEVVYKPRLDLDRLDNDVYDHIDTDGHIVDNNPKKHGIANSNGNSIANGNANTNEAVFEELKSKCNVRYDAKFTNAWRKNNFHNGINILHNFISPSQDDNKGIVSECSIHQEVSEPILVSLPFVTESTKISIVVPVAEQDKSAATNFLKNFAKMCLERNDRVFLMLVFLYTKAHPEKNNNQDFFKEVKQTALQFTKKYKKKDKGSSILWYSLQTKDSTPVQVQGMDLLIQKLDSKSMILLGSPYMELHNDYLNRVRMNTVEGRLVFSPIPYTDYNPQVLGGNGFSSTNANFNTTSGHFDENNFEHISFYKSDYLALRTHLKSPVILKETDLASKDELKNIPTELFRLNTMFQDYGYLRNIAQESSPDDESKVDASSPYAAASNESGKRKGLHVLRAPDPSLRLRYKTVKCEENAPDEIIEDCRAQQLHSLGSRNLLANIFLKNTKK